MNVVTSLSSEPLDDMPETDDVVAVVVHGEPGQDGDGDAGAGRQQCKPVLCQSLLFHFSICRYRNPAVYVISTCLHQGLISFSHKQNFKNEEKINFRPSGRKEHSISHV